ncbi:MAG: glycosyltransferase family 4 protein, partial [Deinococcales bacterium]|nr:glycosyltransferase family 4 protein [Chitinophagaceae bacterium]
MLIAVSNPSKQYTHQTVAALSNNPNYQVYFLTSFWFMPQHIWWHNWLSKIPQINNQLKKKSGDIIPPNIVVTHFSGILYSFIGRFFYNGEKRSFIEDKIHDKWAAKWVKTHQPNVFIGYEKSCSNSFKAVKQYGGKTVLDLAQVHINFIEQLRYQYPFFQQITGDEKLYNSIKKIKLEEYQLADFVTTLSNFAKDTMIENGYPTYKVSVVNIGANTQLFKAKQAYNSTNAKPIKLLFVGAVTKRKGIHILCEVMQELVHENITLDIIGPLGDGIDLSSLLENNNRIQHTPYLHHSELAIKMQAADIFVFPSYLDSWA